MAMSLRASEPLTADRLMAERPDDGRRHELIDGTELVTPAAAPRHQLAVTQLILLLSAAASAGLRVLAAPVDWRVNEATVVQPDVLVVDEDDLDGSFLTRTPRLVVEVASPSTALADRTIKRAACEAAEVPAYWLLEPDVPRLLVLERDGDRLVERHTLTDQESAELTLPFPMTVSPARLV
jgi:Uma2 family endonuclease